MNFLEIEISNLQTIGEAKVLWPSVEESSVHLFGNSVGNAVRAKGLSSRLMLLYLAPHKSPYHMKGIAYQDDVHIVPVVVKIS